MSLSSGAWTMCDRRPWVPNPTTIRCSSAPMRRADTRYRIGHTVHPWRYLPPVLFQNGSIAHQPEREGSWSRDRSTPSTPLAVGELMPRPVLMPAPCSNVPPGCSIELAWDMTRRATERTNSNALLGVPYGL